MQTYWSVRVGRLDHITGPNEWPFPNERAAVTFAEAEHALHPRRVVIVKRPNGTVKKRYGRKPRSLARAKGRQAA